MRFQSNAYKVTMIFPKKYPDGSPILTSAWFAMTNELRELESDFTEIPVRVSGEAKRTTRAACILLLSRHWSESNSCGTS